MLGRRNLDQVAPAPVGGRVVCIGVFDGVHIGHQRIVRESVADALANGGRPTAVTFEPHPDEVLRPGSGPGLLTLPHRRSELLQELGVQEVVTVEFDPEFARLQPEAFCRAVLSSRLGARTVYVGKNFRFGRAGSGTTDDLSAFGLTHGFEVHSVGLVTEGGEPVSSTRIRNLLAEGKVAEAAVLLGRPHRLEGVVVRGAGRGRELGSPTANLLVPDNLVIPASGVYATLATVQATGERHEAVTSIGTNPTFAGAGATLVETLMMGYEGDLYESGLAVDFIARLRSQRVFADAEALAAQIRQDVKDALKVHAALGEASNR